MLHLSFLCLGYYASIKCSFPHCRIQAHHPHFHMWIKPESGSARSGLGDGKVRDDKQMCKQVSRDTVESLRLCYTDCLLMLD